MKKYRLIKTLVVILASILQNEVVGQTNVIIRNESHFVANLDFTPSASVYKQRKNRIVNASHNQGFPNEYSEKNITVKGMVEAAVLTMDWWTLFGEPVENYNFQWTSTRKYHISEYGGRLNMTVTRDMVSKYPDLLMRFDAIKPLDIKFKIYWKHNEEAYKKNLHYLFSSGNLNQSVTTNVNTGLLFEPSGKEPLSVPGIRQGKGLQFIDQKFDSYQHYDLNEEQKKSWIVEFNKTNKIIIDQFFVSDIKWPVGEMKAIAELYEQYENGEKKPSPMEIVNEEVRKNQNLTAYNNNDFWGDAFISDSKKLEIFKNANTIGIKKFGRITYQEDRKNVEYVRKFIDNACPWYYVTFINNEKFKNYSPISNSKYKTSTKIINDEGQLQSIGGYTQFDSWDVLENRKTALYIYLEEYKKISNQGLSWVFYNDKRGGFNSFDEASDRIRRNLGQGHPDNMNIGVGKYKRLTIDENLNVLEDKTVFMILFEIK